MFVAILLCGNATSRFLNASVPPLWLDVQYIFCAYIEMFLRKIISEGVLFVGVGRGKRVGEIGSLSMGEYREEEGPEYQGI